MNKLNFFSSIKVTLASPQQILSWSHGEVKKAETINYRTQRAEVDGLMCEKIFGPTNNYQCYCGKYKKVRYKGIICDKCGVEVTHNRVRRERMGHIKLAAPAVHIWFSHGVPNKLSLILDIPKKKLESVIYFARYVITSLDTEKQKKVRKQVRDKLKGELDSLNKEMENEVNSKKKLYKKEIDTLKTKGEKGLTIESLKGKLDKEVAELKELFSRKEKKILERYEELLTLIEKMHVGEVLSEDQNSDLADVGAQFYEIKMGAEGIKTLLSMVDIDGDIKKLTKMRKETRSKLKERKIMARLRILGGLKKDNIDPTWVVMEVVPVIPPVLRPIIQLPGGRFATSDLNDLYRRVINRNNRLQRLMDLGAPAIILRNEKRMLQEAVDALIDNSHRPGRPILNSRGQPYKSLSDIMRGKQGRFRQNLLGKRVDYSGRGVIVAGPDLDLFECGLPKVVALELFKPFVMREVIARGLSPNIKSAKNFVEEQSPEVWDILEEVIKERPVLLNRAPTLHKQGLQAFFPVLTEGNAIRIHPMVCKGFNADFDGDQMAVHVPLSKKAVDECLKKMMPDSNMLLMANGNPVVNVNKEMVLGIFMLTRMIDNKKSPVRSYADKDAALIAYDLRTIKLNEKIKLLLHDKIIETTIGRIIFNQAFLEDFKFVNETITQSDANNIIAYFFKTYGKKETVKVLNYFNDIGFKYATSSGYSISMEDLISPEEREDLLMKAEKQIERLNESYYNGFITEDEKKSLSEEVWMKVTEEISDLTWKIYEKKSKVFLLEHSGAYPVKNPTRQISGIRGLILDPMGNIVELPLRSNYSKGLGSLEYFVAARGTRKGLTDTALKTSGSGYLTRKMIDVAHDVITREDDCGTKNGVILSTSQNRRIAFEKRLVGRWTVQKINDPKTKKMIVDRNEEITEEKATEIVKKEIEELIVRSPLTCISEEGICCKCYGHNFGTRRLVKKGVAVGVIAGQAMGEAATQLTLDTRHLAGRAGTDITQGLPRIEELFEARMPKVKAIISEIEGKVSIKNNKNDITELVTVTTRKPISKLFSVNKGDKILVKKSGKVKSGKELIKRKNGKVAEAPYDGKLTIEEGGLRLERYRVIKKEYKLMPEEDLIVKDGDSVNIGDQLTVGSVDPSQLMKLKGLTETQQYIINNVQGTYGLQGISIDDKHVEVIVRKMASLATVEHSGGSTHLPGGYVNYYEILSENKDLKKKRKEPVRVARKLLGITSASINTGSFLSAASFQEVVRVLSDVALVGRTDKLRGLKENVIIGRPVPLGEYLR